MITLLPKSDSRAKIIHITAGITILIGLTSAMMLRFFEDHELRTVLFLIYVPVIIITWKLVLILSRKIKISTAILPGLWFFVLGLIMLAISIPALIIITPRETDMGLGFIIFITVVVPGIFVLCAGFVLLLIGTALNKLQKRIK